MVKKRLFISRFGDQSLDFWFILILFELDFIFRCSLHLLYKTNYFPSKLELSWACLLVFLIGLEMSATICGQVRQKARQTTLHTVSFCECSLFRPFNLHPEKWFVGYPEKSTQMFIRWQITPSKELSLRQKKRKCQCIFVVAKINHLYWFHW